MPLTWILLVVTIAFALFVRHTMLGPQGLVSMRRILVFSLLGPVLGTASAVLLELGAGRVPEEGIASAFIFSLVVSIVAGPVDGYLAHFIPFPLRAPLSAIVGAATVALLLVSITERSIQLQA
jgi:hypothetical protein